MGQSKVLYAVGKAVCKPVFKLLYRYKTIIEEPLPLVGGMIIASNHISNSGSSSSRFVAEKAQTVLYGKN